MKVSIHYMNPIVYYLAQLLEESGGYNTADKCI